MSQYLLSTYATEGEADKVAEATNHPIEVRPFRATGRLEA